MKKIQKRFLGLLLACMMVCLPVAQAAAVSYDASEGVADEILFPGDSLINIGVPVTQDGAEVALDPAGTWVNNDENRAFRAAMAEDGSGSIVLSAAGYVLVVENGTSGKKDAPEGEASNHYEFAEGEKPEDVSQDIAFYQNGDVVKLKADEPKEGMVFAGWTTGAEDVTFEDASNPETTMTMPEKKVTVKANYTEAQPEAAKYTLTVNDGVLADSAQIDPNGYEANTQLTVQANDRSGENLTFTGWTAEPADMLSAEQLVQPTLTFTMPESNVTLTANYQEAAPTTYEVTVDGVSVGSYEAGAQVSITANDRTAENLTFTGWATEQADLLGADLTQQTLTFTMPESNVAFTTTYEAAAPTTYEVTVIDGVLYGGVTTNTYEAGAWVDILANDYSAEGRAFTGWTVDSAEVALGDAMAAQTGFAMPEGNVTVTANYEQIQSETPESDPSDTPNGDPSGDPGNTLNGDPSGDPGNTPNGDPSGDPGNTPSGDPVTTVYKVTVTDGALADGKSEGEYAKDTDVTVTANAPAENKVFDKWVLEIGTIENIDLTTATITFKMPAGEVKLAAQYKDAPQQETPAPQPKTYPVTLANGTLNDGTGQTAYTAGASVAVKASAINGKKFVGWTGTAANGAEVAFVDKANPETSFTMPEGEVTITANYVDVYTVSVKDGVLGDGQTSGTYAEGDTVKVKANAAADGMKFTGWTGVIAVTGGAVAFADASQTETAFTMPASGVELTAVYESAIPTYRVTVANGTINGSSTDVTVDQGTQVTITANPNPSGQAFAGWKITDASGNAVDPAALGIDAYSSNVTVSVSQALNFQAQYEGIQYKITVKKGAANYETAVGNTTVTITADDAPEGKEFDYWEVISGNVALKDAYSQMTTFEMPSADVTVKAHYRDKEYRLGVENGYSDYEFYKMGDKATVSSDYPASGKEFDKWVAVSGNAAFADASRWQTSFTMPGSDVSVKATYKNGPSADNNKIIDIVSGGEYYTGDAIKFTASGAGMDNSNPNPGDYRYRPAGYQIGNVTGSWNASPYATTMAIKAPGEYTLKVTYNKQVYDGDEWVSDGTTDTKSVTFRVIQKAAGVATGDNTPIVVVAVIAGVSCLIFLGLLIVFIRRRRK